MKKVGETIVVKASKFLGTPQVRAKILAIEHFNPPIADKCYYIVSAEPAVMRGDISCAQALQEFLATGGYETFECDIDGTCLTGPPLDNNLVRAP